MSDLFATLSTHAKAVSKSKDKNVVKKTAVKKKPKVKVVYNLYIKYNRALQGFTLTAYGKEVEKLLTLASLLDIQERQNENQYAYRSADITESRYKHKSELTSTNIDVKRNIMFRTLKIAVKDIPIKRLGLFVNEVRRLNIYEYCNIRRILYTITKKRFIMSLPHRNVRVASRKHHVYECVKPGMSLRKVTSNISYKIHSIEDNKVFIVQDIKGKKTKELLDMSQDSIFELIRAYDIPVNERREMISDTFEIQRSEKAMRTIEEEFKEEFKDNIKTIDQTGIDLWGCQASAVARLCLKRHGILHAAMGLGKSRMYGAACLCYGGKYHLLVTEPQLVKELQRELKEVNIESKIIEDSKDTRSLKQFNIMSYTALQRKSSIRANEKKGKTIKTDSKAQPLRKTLNYRTIADDLKKIRFDTVTIDECHNIKNHLSQRTIYITKLKAKHLIFGSGTVLGNTFGDMATYINIINKGKVNLLRRSNDESGSESNIISALTVIRGNNFREKMDNIFDTPDNEILVEELLDNACVSVWNTDSKIKDTVLNGINYGDLSMDLSVRDSFRNELQGNRYHTENFRRVYDMYTIRLRHDHPEVLSDVVIPPHEEKIVTVKTSIEHIATYKKAMKKLKTELSDEDISSITMFSAIRNMLEACDIPQRLGLEGEQLGPEGLSPKQDSIVRTAAAICKKGSKIICFTTAPLMTQILETAMHKEDGLNPIALYSSMNIARRNKSIDAFRFGKHNILISGYSLCGRGYNIPQANIVIEASQTWSVYNRAQAMARIIRPQQKKHPIILRFRTEGMIDDYMIHHSIIRESDMENIPDGIERKLITSGPKSAKEVLNNVMDMIGQEKEEEDE